MRSATPWRAAFCRATCQSRARDIGRDDSGRGPLDRERDREAAAARAKVGGRQAAVRIGNNSERDLDDQLRFLARDQHGGGNLERQPPEFLLSDDVGERLAADAPLDERFVFAREI